MVDFSTAPLSEKMKIIQILFILFISGCSASWHGRSQEIEFKYKLKFKNGYPAKNVNALCVGNAGVDSISQILAQEINSKKSTSNENGLLVLTRRSSEIYGSYSYIGPITFNNSSTSLKITCELIYEHQSIHKLELTWNPEPQVIVLNQ